MPKKDSVRHIVYVREVLVAAQQKFVTLKCPIVLLLLRQYILALRSRMRQLHASMLLATCAKPRICGFLGARRGESCREMTSGPLGNTEFLHTAENRTIVVPVRMYVQFLSIASAI